MKSWATKLGACEFKVLRLQDAPLEKHLGDTPQSIVTYLRGMLPTSARYNPDTESFVVVFLNSRRRIIGFEIITNGTLDTLLVHAREVFKPAIVINAAAVVLAHNHPSGDPTPSEADIKVTRDLVKAGQLLKIEVLDHVILGDQQHQPPHCSLRELGYFYT
jgi:DNA repair protein RadC